MFLSIIFLINCMGDPIEWMAVDEVYANQVYGAAFNGHTALLAISGQPFFKLVLYNHEMRRFRNIEDGRMSGGSTVLSVGKGFAVINAVGTAKVTYLDGDGNFLSSEELVMFEGWEKNKKVRKVAPVDHGKALVTFQSWRDDAHFLAVLDLNRKTSTTVFARNFDEKDQYPFWLSNGTDTLLLNPQTGRIDLLDNATYASLRTLRAGGDPVKRDAVRFKRLARRRPFLSLLTAPLLVDGTLEYRLNKGAVKSGEDLKGKRQYQTVVQLPNGTFREKEFRTLAIFESERLVYHWQDQEFRILPRQEN